MSISGENTALNEITDFRDHSTIFGTFFLKSLFFQQSISVLTRAMPMQAYTDHGKNDL